MIDAEAGVESSPASFGSRRRSRDARQAKVDLAGRITCLVPVGDGHTGPPARNSSSPRCCPAGWPTVVRRCAEGGRAPPFLAPTGVGSFCVELDAWGATRQGERELARKVKLQPDPRFRLKRDRVPNSVTPTNPCVAPFCCPAPKSETACVVAAYPPMRLTAIRDPTLHLSNGFRTC